MKDNEQEELRDLAVSLSDTLNRKIERETLLANFCSHLENLVAKPIKEVLEIYSQYDLLCGNRIVVMPKGKENPERYEAKALHFTPLGSLKVMLDSEEIKELYAEEVTIRPVSSRI